MGDDKPSGDRAQEAARATVEADERKRTPGPTDCPTCGTPGSLVHQSQTTIYYVCPDCEHTWRVPRAVVPETSRKRSQR